MRSLLFVPADRDDRFIKAQASGADAIILDLEDSVSPERKNLGRENIRQSLREPAAVARLVRINPLEAECLESDLACARGADGLVLPKARGASSLLRIVEAWGVGCPKILPIATETPAAIFSLGSYHDARSVLLGLTWGAEDLSAAIGAASARDTHGQLTDPYRVARALALFAAHAAGTAAIETVYPSISDLTGLASFAANAAHDGFTGMLAIHPTQVPIINRAFCPTDYQVEYARRVVEAFESRPAEGAIRMDGQMLDGPHLKHARSTLARWKASSKGGEHETG